MKRFDNMLEKTKLMPLLGEGQSQEPMRNLLRIMIKIGTPDNYNIGLSNEWLKSNTFENLARFLTFA